MIGLRLIQALTVQDEELKRFRDGQMHPVFDQKPAFDWSIHFSIGGGFHIKLTRGDFDDHKHQRGEPMKSGRKTTQEERIEIVQDCFNHNRNYKETAEKYDCSYTQVRNWTIKFEQDGEEALIDGRGRIKKEEELTQTELLERKIADLERRTWYLEMETELLKKPTSGKGG